MKKRWVILLALGLLLVIVAAFRSGRLAREPEYQGKKLTDWVRIGAPRIVGWDRAAAEEAVHKMGTSALPWLVLWLDDGPRPVWETKALKIMAKLPKQFGGNYARNLLSPSPEWIRFNFARDGIRTLGNDARPAIPDLLRLAKKPGCQRGGDAAASILIHFGEELQPQLIKILHSPNAPGRRPVIDHFQHIGAAALGTNANAAVEGLVLCLNDTDRYTRTHAILALGNLMLRPDIVVPALAKTCNDADPAVREAALGALSAYGEAARPGRAAVVQALHDSDAEVRAVAGMALEQIPD